MQLKLLIVLKIILNRWGVYMKKLIVACGSGVATSTTIAEKIKSRLESKNVNCQVEAVDISQLCPNCQVLIFMYI